MRRVREVVMTWQWGVSSCGSERGEMETHGDAACVLDGFAQVLHIRRELGYRDAGGALLVIVAELYDRKSCVSSACEGIGFLPGL